jgi:hypothetical protein
LFRVSYHAMSSQESDDRDTQHYESEPTDSQLPDTQYSQSQPNDSQLPDTQDYSDEEDGEDRRETQYSEEERPYAPSDRDHFAPPYTLAVDEFDEVPMEDDEEPPVHAGTKRKESPVRDTRPTKIRPPEKDLTEERWLKFTQAMDELEPTAREAFAEIADLRAAIENLVHEVEEGSGKIKPTYLFSSMGITSPFKRSFKITNAVADNFYSAMNIYMFPRELQGYDPVTGNDIYRELGNASVERYRPYYLMLNRMLNSNKNPNGTYESLERIKQIFLDEYFKYWCMVAYPLIQRLAIARAYWALAQSYEASMSSSSFAKTLYAVLEDEHDDESVSLLSNFLAMQLVSGFPFPAESEAEHDAFVASLPAVRNRTLYYYHGAGDDPEGVPTSIRGVEYKNFKKTGNFSRFSVPELVADLWNAQKKIMAYADLPESMKRFRLFPDTLYKYLFARDDVADQRDLEAKIEARLAELDDHRWAGLPADLKDLGAISLDGLGLPKLIEQIRKYGKGVLSASNSHFKLPVNAESRHTGIDPRTLNLYRATESPSRDVASRTRDTEITIKVKMAYTVELKLRLPSAHTGEPPMGVIRIPLESKAAVKYNFKQPISRLPKPRQTGFVEVLDELDTTLSALGTALRLERTTFEGVEDYFHSMMEEEEVHEVMDSANIPYHINVIDLPEGMDYNDRPLTELEILSAAAADYLIGEEEEWIFDPFAAPALNNRTMVPTSEPHVYIQSLFGYNTLQKYSFWVFEDNPVPPMRYEIRVPVRHTVPESQVNEALKLAYVSRQVNLPRADGTQTRFLVVNMARGPKNHTVDYLFQNAQQDPDHDMVLRTHKQQWVVTVNTNKTTVDAARLFQMTPERLFEECRSIFGVVAAEYIETVTNGTPNPVGLKNIITWTIKNVNTESGNRNHFLHAHGLLEVQYVYWQERNSETAKPPLLRLNYRSFTRTVQSLIPGAYVNFQVVRKILDENDRRDFEDRFRKYVEKAKESANRGSYSGVYNPGAGRTVNRTAPGGRRVATIRA